MSKSTNFKLRTLIDVSVVVGIGWFAWEQAGFLLRDDLYLYGDHPGQFYRLWLLLDLVWPAEGRLVGWSPYWYAGRPELQLYPPGFSLAGWLLWMVTFQQISPVAIYQTLVFTSFVLPALGFYGLLAWGLGDRLAGLAAAWLAMAFPFPLGGAQGVFIGIVSFHLAYGLVPLFLLSGIWLMRAEHKAWPWLAAGLTLAGIILVHPYQIFFPFTVLGLYILFCRQNMFRRMGWLGLVALFALGLTAFWWLPLTLRREHFTPILEESLTGIRAHFANLWWPGMVWLLGAALIGSWLRSGSRRWLSLAIMLGGAGMAAFVFFDYLVLVEQLNFFAIEPVRLIPGVTFALFTALALGVSELAWLGPRSLNRWGRAAWGWPLLLLVPWLTFIQITEAYNFAWMEKFQPKPDGTPIFLSEADARYGLASVWEVTAQTPGRVLYTSHYGHLFDVPTSLKALTPYLANREIIGGIFTLHSPIAGYFWTGRYHPPLIRGKIEAEDDKTFAGRAWDKMPEDFFLDLARRFNVSLVATTALDRNAQAFLEASPNFNPAWSNGLFTFYEMPGYDPTWVEAQGAAAAVNRYEPTAIDVQVTGAEPGARLSVKVANYPLWQAEAEGQPLPIETDAYGLMTIPLHMGSYTLHLRYVPGWPERLGDLISLVSAVGAVAGVWLLRQKPTRACSPA